VTGPSERASAALGPRLLFTLSALVIYRLGTFIPLPGIDPHRLEALFGLNAGGMLGTLDMVSEFGHISIFALGIMPYLTASWWVLLVGALWPRLGALSRKGGRTLDRYVRGAALALAALQGYEIAVALESLGPGRSPVVDPGALFHFATMAAVTGGTAVLMWLADQITTRGIGNGVALILFSGIVARMPSELGWLLELGRTGEIPTVSVLLSLVAVIGLLGLMVFVERAHRRVRVQYRPRLVGTRMFQGEGAWLHLKVNQAGIAPLLLAAPFLRLPATIAGYGTVGEAAWGGLGPGEPAFVIFHAALVTGLCFLYLALISRPKQMAETLDAYAGFIPGYDAGGTAADHLRAVLAPLALVSAAYLIVVGVVPEFLRVRCSIPPGFDGVELLIAVSVILDLAAQLSAERGRHER
jgi:preprotein translocase subunit SecY